ncbi:MAG: saccharopine dehydrogenase NADP-binding domain-containing protein, partial [Inquilinus limosus]|nr:saccharopine dehydrogenase NADP-binding domain-containing protein [Inquilinus limosus]
MTEGRLRILILGGYGTFGGRLARLLAHEPRLTLLIAGRSRAKAEAFCRALGGAAETVPLAFDRDGDAAAGIAAAGAEIVVDATGPFQAYGEAPYRVVEACIAAGADYLDLADGADFVEGIGRFDEGTRVRGVAVLSGVSSFPVLTAAVVRHLARGLAHVDSIEGGIAPSPYAGVGLNVIRAIASYAGREVRLTRDGAPASGRALVETRRWTIAPPGRLPLRSTRFSLVDVPDLRLLPALWPGLSEIWIGAGPVPPVLHRGLNALARLV